MSEKLQNGSTGHETGKGQGTEKKAKGDDGGPAFTRKERDEMEALLKQLCGHLGTSSWLYGVFLSVPNVLAFCSCLPDAFLGRRRRRKQLFVQLGQNPAHAYL